MPVAYLTRLGEQLLAQAAGTNSKVEIAQIALGDAGGVSYNPAENQNAIVNERLRVPVETRQFLGGDSWRVKATVPADAVKFGMREIGFLTATGQTVVIWAGADVEPRQIGLVTFEIADVLNFSGVADGLLVVEAPDDELFDHVVVDLETQALTYSTQYDLQMAVRALQAAT